MGGGTGAGAVGGGTRAGGAARCACVRRGRKHGEGETAEEAGNDVKAKGLHGWGTVLAVLWVGTGQGELTG